MDFLTQRHGGGSQRRWLTMVLGATVASLIMAIVGTAAAAAFVADWGNNSYGQLGNGTRLSSDVPVFVSPLTEEVTAVASGARHNLALLSNGTVMAWGRNALGQLGDGTTVDKHEPVAVTGLTEAV